MKQNQKARYLINEPEYSAANGRPKLLRIEFSPEYTKVDFGYQATNYFVKGGWVRIAVNTFIRLKQSEEKHIMTRAVNIPISPIQHEFDTAKDWLYYSLYFPHIPFQSGMMDLIECEPGTDRDFNYWDIKIDSRKKIEIK